MSWQNPAIDMPASHEDHLKVLEKPNRPSADFFHGQASRCAPPQHLAQLDDLDLQLLQGPDLPATRAVLPASKNSAFHPPIDCSLTFSPRAASAMDTSPANTFNTIRHRTQGRPHAQALLQDLHNTPATYSTHNMMPTWPTPH